MPTNDATEGKGTNPAHVITLTPSTNVDGLTMADLYSHFPIEEHSSEKVHQRMVSERDLYLMRLGEQLLHDIDRFESDVQKKVSGIMFLRPKTEE
jgi:hypothetical protein